MCHIIPKSEFFIYGHLITFKRCSKFENQKNKKNICFSLFPKKNLINYSQKFSSRKFFISTIEIKFLRLFYKLSLLYFFYKKIPKYMSLTCEIKCKNNKKIEFCIYSMFIKTKLFLI